MKKIILIILLVCTTVLSFGKDKTKNVAKVKIQDNSIGKLGTKKFYNKLNISKELDYKVFEMAISGYNKITPKNKDEIIIIDFSKNSDEERFFFIDLKNAKIKSKTYVAHGKNSGAERALSFSNQPNSYKSSIGFFLTRSHYKGRYGYSIRLKGLDDEFNSNAVRRGIVIHGSKESEKSYIERYGFLGRTEGCPALPLSISFDIMKNIKENTVLFIYGEDEEYLKNSIFLNKK